MQCLHNWIQGNGRWGCDLVFQFLLVFLLGKILKGPNGCYFPLWGSLQIVPLIMSLMVLHIYIPPDMKEETCLIMSGLFPKTGYTGQVDLSLCFEWRRSRTWYTGWQRVVAPYFFLGNDNSRYLLTLELKVMSLFVGYSFREFLHCCWVGLFFRIR